MAINIRVDTSDVMRALRRLSKEDAPIVTAYALTKTAQDIKAAEIETMKEVFDRPTRFTLNALAVKPATKRNLSAEVFFKEGFGSVPAWRYLGPQVEGGPRQHKSFEKRLIAAGHMKPDEFAVPGQGAKLDQSGNMTGPTIERILSQVQAAGGAGYQANATDSRRSKAKRKKSGNYFVLRAPNVAAGVYYRAPGERELMPVIMFVKPPRYQKRFPFYERAQFVFSQRFLPHAMDGFERFVLSKLPKAA